MKREPHLIEAIMKSTKDFNQVIAGNYDRLCPMASKDDKLLWDMILDWEPFYKGNKHWLKKTYKLHNITYKSTGDPEEPTTTTITMVWHNDHEWRTYCKIESLLSLCLLQFNCCDRVVNPDPEFADQFGKPTPDTWALLGEDSYIIETDGFITMALTFAGHYHS